MRAFKLIIFLTLISATIMAQSMSDLSRIAAEKGKVDVRPTHIDLQKLSEEAREKEASLLQTMKDYVPLEGMAVDSLYIIGPHDIMSATFVIAESDESKSYELLVNPDGEVIIPSWGAVVVAGLTLREARDEIRERIQNMYRVRRLTVNLVRARIFRAHITGFVQLPGAYNVMASFRVERLLEMAGGQRPNADLSRIMIFRGNDTLIVNLNDYYLKGDINSNPMLIDGDIVYVPAISPSETNVFLGGAVQRNGKYPIYEGQRLSTLVPDVVDMNANFDLTKVKVVRNGIDYFVNLEIDQDISLSAEDLLIIPIQSDSVFVTGHVTKGGQYQYIPHKDYRAYLAMAGGPTDRGSMRRVTIYREGERLNPRRINAVMPGDVIYVKASYFNLTLDFVSMLSQSATVAIAIYTINRNRN